MRFARSRASAWRATGTFAKAGTYSKTEGPHREVTFIEREAVEAAERDEGVAIPPERTRRNVLTEGVALNHLVGREFSVGEVRFLGIKLSEPCGHMEKLSGVAGARKALIHRGGLRARVLNEGILRVGDPIDTSE
ncbi:MAG: MOSC domain-containing protein [Actinomycetota bacterium]